MTSSVPHDHALVDVTTTWLARQFQNVSGYDLLHDQALNPRSWMRLRTVAQKAIHALESRSAVRITVKRLVENWDGPNDLSVRLTRELLEELKIQAADQRQGAAGLGPGKVSARAKLQEHQRGMVDLCFVFDTTGSMNNKIDGLISCMTEFVRELSDISLDWRISIVPFGDLIHDGPNSVVSDRPFVNTLAEADTMLHGMPRFGGGGNNGESSIEAMLAALKKAYRPHATKILILITDEPALTHNRRPEEVTAALLAMDTIAFVVSPDHEYYKAWTEASGGDWRVVGKTVDTSAMIALLRDLARRIASAAAEVRALGSVSAYRAALGQGDHEDKA